jgi:serine/threonine-protein phosphatase PP1 catalytic subunit
VVFLRIYKGRLHLYSMEAVRCLRRPLDILDNGLVADLLWSDPADDIDDWTFNEERGVSFKFGRKQVDEFLLKFNYELV